MEKDTKRFAAIAGVGGIAVIALAGSALADSYTVQEGDTLWQLAGSNYQEVARANGIEDPNLIYTGQVIELPGGQSGASDEPPDAPSPDAPDDPDPVSDDNVDGGVWDRLAQCESSGDWHINTGNGYYGGLQFLPSSWRAAGGSGMPHEASKAEQIRVAENLLAMQGWGAWPSCASQLGLR